MNPKPIITDDLSCELTHTEYTWKVYLTPAQQERLGEIWDRVKPGDRELERIFDDLTDVSDNYFHERFVQFTTWTEDARDTTLKVLHRWLTDPIDDVVEALEHHWDK